MRRWVAVSAVALLAALVLVACDQEDVTTDPLGQVEGNGSGPITDENRADIERLADDYVAALNEGDEDRLRELAHSDLDDREMELILGNLERGYELLDVEVQAVEGDRDGAIAALFLRDDDGAEVNHALHVRPDNGEWRIYRMH